MKLSILKLEKLVMITVPNHHIPVEAADTVAVTVVPTVTAVTVLKAQTLLKAQKLRQTQVVTVLQVQIVHQVPNPVKLDKVTKPTIYQT